VTLLRLLKLDWTFFGLKAPQFAWVGGPAFALLGAATTYGSVYVASYTSHVRPNARRKVVSAAG
jgi:hypothetical protein